MSAAFGKLLAKLADKQTLFIQELLAYLEEKKLMDDFAEWQAKRNKERETKQQS